MQTFTQLNEAWADVYTAAEAMQQHPKAWIHFTDIAKIGVNPGKGHHDPHGIYFYPISWLLYSDDNSLSQYATSNKYYYIVEFSKKANIMDLNKLDDGKASAYAEVNGWLEYYEKGKANPRILLDNCVASNPKKVKTAGFTFFATADVLVNRPEKLGATQGQFTWSSLFAGIAGMKDKYGVINMNEPEQAYVVSSRDFKVIAFGENKDKTANLTFETFKAAVSKVADQNAPIKIGWKHQVPTAQITFKGANFTILYIGSSIVIERHDADGTVVPSYDQMRMMEVSFEYSIDSVVRTVSHTLQSALNKSIETQVPECAKGFDFAKIAQTAQEYFRGKVNSDSRGNEFTLALRFDINSRFACNISDTGANLIFSSMNGLDKDVRLAVPGNEVSSDRIVQAIKTLYDMTVEEMHKKYVGIPTDPERLIPRVKSIIGIK